MIKVPFIPETNSTLIITLFSGYFSTASNRVTNLAVICEAEPIMKFNELFG
jgi:hypothetical protein